VVIFSSRERKGVKAKEREKVKCPIFRSENCTRKEIEPSLLEFVCSLCTTLPHSFMDMLFRRSEPSDEIKRRR
jgi:hypothetical protein